MLNVSEFAPRENELIAREITHHPVDDLEPIPDGPTPYRTAAIECMQILASVELFNDAGRRPEGLLGLLSHARSD